MSSTKNLPSNPAGITGQLCSWITSTNNTEIPEDVLERAKYLILDGIACAFVGAHLPWSETAARALLKMEPQGQCSVIGWQGRQLSPMAATVLNSTFIQGFELDDYHSKAPLHSSSLLLPALFAAVQSAYSETKIFTGAEFIKAYVVGCEIGPRVGMALHGGDLLSRGWHSGAIQGPSAVAAATASLLGLTSAQVESALGIACTQAGGLMAAQFGSDAKRMQHGFAARNGLFGTLLAQEGYTGIQEVYEVPYGGFLSCFSQGASFEPKSLPQELVSELGSRWEIEGVRVKLHAAMAALHGTIDCVEHLQKTKPELFDLGNLGNIESVVTRHGKAAYEHGGWIAPTDKPLSSLGAQMSIQYAAAAQLLDSEVLMAQFGASKLNRPEVGELMAKIHPKHDPSIDVSQDSLFTTYVDVTFKDGTKASHMVAAARGIDPPCSNEDIVEKWRALTRDVLDEDRRDQIEKKVLSLDTLSDVLDLMPLLEGNVKCPIDVA
ncbi:2-methylcitrate dehydratase PrpD [Setomelanomma holmii]|uniref:2-methylcitrate dehydratase PrpD n=1 Tax=Setomelanomma holmii TaxID=210430 RepID=A0A9P4H1P4_9PLEO|nr:2-methylcitrate dehydratase PrpD [Setomelanomma holmii]